MVQIIPSSTDVTLLSSSGIIQNEVGCDKAVAMLFNHLTRTSRSTKMAPSATCSGGCTSTATVVPTDGEPTYIIRVYLKGLWALLILYRGVIPIGAYHHPDRLHHPSFS
ncbi:hypothetical protein QJS10_CPA16g00726 [Acorus calamus]|uniref:Uncharacterized protein n=1 Tax=Acorus calamus TaxID=4465 RepID=A0AAV9CXZ0_ACOCL|nr:hypothetical protein QJS10_CPA16g00726 [Acorus calamus]